MAITAVRMPRLGMTMEEGRVVAWRVALGAPVRKGELLLVIESEKSEVEIEATASGVLRHVYVAEGRTVPCGSLLAALCDAPGEAFDAEAYAAAAARDPAAPRPPAVRTAQPAAARPAAPGETRAAARRKVAPAARARASQLGVDVELVAGTGPGGRVTREDVEAFAALRERRVEVAQGVALELLREGQGAPLLLLPGFGSDASSFGLLAPRLAARFQVLALNPRGVAGSDAPDEARYEVAQMAADAAAALEGAAGEPARVVGASLGAAVAIELALARPELLRSLVLVTPFTTATPRLLAVLEAWRRVAAEASAETLAHFLAPLLFSDALLADATARERTLRGLAAAAARIPAATLERSAAGLAAWSGTRTGDLARIRIPTRVLAAGADLLVPDAESVARSIPGATYRCVPGAGHALAIEAAELLAAELLAELDPRA